MRLITTSSYILCLLLGFAVQISVSYTETFSNFHAKLTAAAPLELDDAAYDQLTSPIRDYSVAILLTALESRYGCQLCREFQPEWDLLAKSWTKGDKQGDSRLLYGTLDFADGRKTFQALGLQTAPVLLLFQPTRGPFARADGAPLRYDFTNGPQTAELSHAWIARHLHDRPHPRVHRPVNWIRAVALATTLLVAITLLSVAWPYVLPIVQNRNVWAATSLIAILLFSSGHMFNHIRKVPYVTGDGRGGVSYFAVGFQNQHGLETQIIAAMYGLLSFATISLALKTPRLIDPRTQQLAVLAWSGVIFLMYGFLLSVFRAKNGGYPFWLPPFA